MFLPISCKTTQLFYIGKKTLHKNSTRQGLSALRLCWHINAKRFFSWHINAKRFFSWHINAKRFFSWHINAKRFCSWHINAKRFFSWHINAKRFFSWHINAKRFLSWHINAKRFFSRQINAKRFFSWHINTQRFLVAALTHVFLVDALTQNVIYVMTSMWRLIVYQINVFAADKILCLYIYFSFSLLSVFRSQTQSDVSITNCFSLYALTDVTRWRHCWLKSFKSGLRWKRGNRVTCREAFFKNAPASATTCSTSWAAILEWWPTTELTN